MSAENLAPPGFGPQTVQPVVSHYNDCAILPPHFVRRYGKLKDCNIYLWLKSSFRERNNRVTKLHVVLDFENVK
jgi:hypothetical protein